MFKIFLIVALAFLNSCRNDLLSVSSEVEANRILLSLRENDVDASKFFAKGNWVVSVDSKSFTRSLEILEKKRIYYRSMIGENNLDKDDLFASRSQKNAMAIEKLSKELAVTLLMFPGVIDSKVHLNKGELNDSVSAKLMESASVVLITEAANLIDHENVKIIVSKGTGVPPDSVFVVEKVSSYKSENSWDGAVSVPTNVSAYWYQNDNLIWIFGSIVLLFLIIISMLFLRSRNKLKKEISVISQVIG